MANYRGEPKRDVTCPNCGCGFKYVAHGTRTRWQYGCRCELCTQANKQYLHDYYVRTRKKTHARST